jgi:hypothetical protein
MHRYELIPDEGNIRIFGSTRAGLLTAAVQGVCAAAEPKPVEDAKDVERSFSVETPDFVTLLDALIAKTISSSQEYTETYREIRFTLVTDKKAEGAFVGRSVSGFGAPISSAKSTQAVAKNKEGEWETTVAYNA